MTPAAPVDVSGACPGCDFMGWWLPYGGLRCSKFAGARCTLCVLVSVEQSIAAGAGLVKDTAKARPFPDATPDVRVRPVV